MRRSEDQGSGTLLSVSGHPERNGAESCRLEEAAYGKLNLTLDVIGKRADGYHDLRMVMCAVDLHDDVWIELGTGTDSCTVQKAVEKLPGCHSEERSDEESIGASSAPLRPAQHDTKGTIPEGEQNLAMKAARAYARAAKLDFGGISIRIDKRIPAQAGMAGGSSDAAAVLRALNRCFGRFSEEDLRCIGLEIGSDVPYCLFGGTALAEGRGEILTRLPPLPEGLCFVLVKPDFSVSTPALFKALDEARDAVGDDIPEPVGSCPTHRADSAAQYIGPYGADPAVGTGAMLRALNAGNAAAVGRALSNDFTSVLAKDYPVIEACKQALLELGAVGSELTGTGSVIFGLFDSPDKAETAVKALSPGYPSVFLTNPC